MGGIVKDQLGSLIDRFYEAAAHQALWRPVLSEASRVLGAEGIEFYPGPNTAFAPVHSASLDEAVAAGIAQGWFADNPRVKRGLPLLTRGADLITESSMFSPEELDRLPFNVEFAGRFGLRWFAATRLSSGGSPSILFSVERRANQEPFSGREQGLLRQILPHLRRSAQLAVSLADGQALGQLEAIDAMRCGGLLVDVRGRVVQLNSRAERSLGDGLTLRQGRLTARQAPVDAALQALVAAATQRGSAHEAPALCPVGIPRRSGTPLIVHAAPIVGTAQDIFRKACALVMIVDPDARRDLDAGLLRQLFDLTAAEARVALALAGGQTIKEAAAASGTTENTIRVQLRSIFAKTGTNRQVELVALLTRLGGL